MYKCDDRYEVCKIVSRLGHEFCWVSEVTNIHKIASKVKNNRVRRTMAILIMVTIASTQRVPHRSARYKKCVPYKKKSTAYKKNASHQKNYSGRFCVRACRDKRYTMLRVVQKSDTVYLNAAKEDWPATQRRSKKVETHPRLQGAPLPSMCSGGVHTFIDCFYTRYTYPSPLHPLSGVRARVRLWACVCYVVGYCI